MGCPIEWCLRAADNPYVSADENVAISWIIEQMEHGEAGERAGGESPRAEAHACKRVIGGRGGERTEVRRNTDWVRDKKQNS